tara:strand:- start:6829 stop:7236 length:408 start_codon:yes stop_codon:yes gene_type:complete
MSSILVDALKGVSAAGSITITGEGNSTTTNLQQGLAKVWCSATIATNTHTIQDSLNVSSLTDGGAGVTSVVINNDMDNDDYSISACLGVSGARLFASLNANSDVTTGSYKMNSINYAGGFEDYDVFGSSVHGDLA